MLVNLCFHIFLTCVVFVGGISQTRNASICQAVGIILHYSTLATVLWVGVTARNIYKQVTKKAKRCQDPDELPPPPRPMLRYPVSSCTIFCYMSTHINLMKYGHIKKLLSELWKVEEQTCKQPCSWEFFVKFCILSCLSVLSRKWE